MSRASEVKGTAVFRATRRFSRGKTVLDIVARVVRLHPEHGREGCTTEFEAGLFEEILPNCS